MAVTLQDEICPGYVATPLIRLSSAQPQVMARAFQFVLLNVDYSAADEVGGIVLPLELMVTPPSIGGFDRTFFEQLQPSQVAFQPQEGGRHLVVLREVAHNRAYGILLVEVAGDVTDPLQAVPRAVP